MPVSRVRTLLLVLVPIISYSIAKFKDSITIAIVGVSALIFIAVWTQWRKTRNTLQVVVAELHEEFTRRLGLEEGDDAIRCSIYLLRSGKLHEDAHYPYIHPFPPTKVCQGIVGRCYRTGKLEYLGEIANAKELFVLFGYTREQLHVLPVDLRSFVCAPIKDPKASRPLGVIVVHSSRVDHLTPDCKELLLQYSQKSREKLASTEF